jgi:hypothetical protein
MLFTLPRVVRIATELGLDRGAALVAWQVSREKLWLWYLGLRQETR